MRHISARHSSQIGAVRLQVRPGQEAGVVAATAATVGSIAGMSDWTMTVGATHAD